MTAAVALESLPVTQKALRELLVDSGLKLTLAERDHVVARWPVRIGRVRYDGRRVAVFRMNERGDWRGVILVGSVPKGYDLVAQENRFRDLLHVSLWLGAHAPPQPSLADGLSPDTTRAAPREFQLPRRQA